ncbi:MAG: hypothetical protein EBV06_04135 [Planctomycetia bacterium]|nr:hypothetical protein [Planctomycetia bacterium]
MRRIVIGIALLLLTFTGCGNPMARVKGKLVENGKEMKFPPNSAAVELTSMGENATTYTAVVNEDGSFEVFASGGQVQPGNYRVGVMLMGKFSGKYPELAPQKSKLTREIKSGSNDFKIDLANPGS